MVVGGSSRGDDLRAQLEAERAATEHWRRVATQRSAEYAQLRHRSSVRALLALERRLGPISGRLATLVRRGDELGERALVALGGVGGRASRDLDELASALRSLPPSPPVERSITLVVVGSNGREPIGVEEPGVDRIVVAVSSGAASAARLALGSATTDLVGVILPTTEPLERGWLARLAAAVTGEVVAATPVLVHPRRPAARATAHDGRVRAAGLSIEVAGLVPTVRSVGAGTAVDPLGAPEDVAAGSVACLLVDRAAYEAAGGLASTDDLDAAAVELCVRLRARGGRTVVVPSAVVLDHRPVVARADLSTPIDPAGEPWRRTLDRSGPALLRSVRPLELGRRRIAITVSAPSRKVAARWGDWHLAIGLADALRRLGHEVRLQTLDEADSPAGRCCDAHLVLRGLHAVRRTGGQQQLLWIISHPESIDGDELDGADLVLVASAAYADHLRTRTATPVEVLLQATDPRRFYPRPVAPSHQRAIIVVAKTRDVLRPVVADALAAGLRPSIYGGGWRDLVDPALIVADHVDNEDLPVIYSSAGVVLNDHWRTMQAWGFVSNRLFDVLACGTPVISDAVPGLAELFDDAVIEYRTPDELREAVDRVLADQTEARARAQRGQANVLASHTFDHRAQALMTLLDGIEPNG